MIKTVTKDDLIELGFAQELQERLSTPVNYY